MHSFRDNALVRNGGASSQREHKDASQNRFDRRFDVFSRCAIGRIGVGSRLWRSREIWWWFRPHGRIRRVWRWLSPDGRIRWVWRWFCSSGFARRRLGPSGIRRMGPTRVGRLRSGRLFGPTRLGWLQSSRLFGPTRLGWLQSSRLLGSTRLGWMGLSLLQTRRLPRLQRMLSSPTGLDRMGVDADVGKRVRLSGLWRLGRIGMVVTLTATN
ncbi:hypothetical protein AMST5_04222 [freshwater sediment metagenome]|uniref:Uncharacterized protein n=1 Tax=freshwater sediment metagenome TaxID=556182 RepID=A0AA48RG01_9ZZZZ